jgi:P27 family predicted phage terminase small subunit
MPGRKPKPTALKLLNGNPGKRKLNRDEPKVEAGRPEAPAFLTDTAREEWFRVIPQLEASGVLAKIDGTALASYCMAFSRWIEAEGQISEYGVLIEEPIIHKDTGEQIGVKLKKNPACTAAMACQKEMRALLALFGMDPSSRSRIKSGGPEEKLSPLAQLLRDRQEARARQRGA